MSGGGLTGSWVILTMGNRPDSLDTAIESLTSGANEWPVVVVFNGAESVPEVAGARVVRLAANLGVPAGRDVGIDAVSTEIVGFLDDDAELRGDLKQIDRAFADDTRLGAVALRIVDEFGATSRRHVPRAGDSTAAAGGDVAYFLGGACAIRREAYEQVGGYFTDLFYGHEEIELSWRLIDAGWRIRYLADVEVFHPRTEISRHAEGWLLTGRNRVWIARRTLPWPVALLHVLSWLVVGIVRAPRGDCRASYVRGWWSGWSHPIERHPISWRAVWQLTRLGRSPII